MKYVMSISSIKSFLSPSMRREWIEMSLHSCTSMYLRSPSMRREWIEIDKGTSTAVHLLTSPSMRREWIEMINQSICGNVNLVSLHAEGVD